MGFMSIGRVGLSSICISCSFCGGVIGLAGVTPNANGLFSPFWLWLEGPPNNVVGAVTEGVDRPNANDLFSAGVVTGGVDGVAPNVKGDFTGVAGDGADGADAPNVNPPLPPEDVEGNKGFGASIFTAGV